MKSSIIYTLLPILSHMAFAAPTPQDESKKDNTGATPSGRWSVKITVGTSSFSIGDITDGSTLDQYISKPCEATGCDGGTPETFSFNGVGAGTVQKLTGTIGMTGNYGSADIQNAMYLALTTAFDKSVTCQTESATRCNLKKRDPESPAQAQDCNTIQIQQCTAVNYLSAATYAPNGDLKGTMTMSGSSQPPFSFSCATFMGLLATPLSELNPVIGEIGAVITAACSG
jgi:hypothetical protein